MKRKKKNINTKEMIKIKILLPDPMENNLEEMSDLIMHKEKKELLKKLLNLLKLERNKYKSYFIKYIQIKKLS